MAFTQEDKDEVDKIIDDCIKAAIAEAMTEMRKEVSESFGEIVQKIAAQPPVEEKPKTLSEMLAEKIYGKESEKVKNKSPEENKKEAIDMFVEALQNKNLGELLGKESNELSLDEAIEEAFKEES